MTHQLNEENTGLKENLKADEEKLTKLDADFKDAQKTIEQLSSELTALKSETSALKEEKNKLNTQLAEVALEKDNLKARLSSIAELKKAIKELKIQMRKVKVEIRKKTKTVDSADGNRGYVIKDGKPTCSAKIKIDVQPALKE